MLTSTHLERQEIILETVSDEDGLVVEHGQKNCLNISEGRPYILQVLLLYATESAKVQKICNCRCNFARNGTKDTSTVESRDEVRLMTT